MCSLGGNGAFESLITSPKTTTVLLSCPIILLATDHGHPVGGRYVVVIVRIDVVCLACVSAVVVV